jgi:hypothetical protein
MVVLLAAFAAGTNASRASAADLWVGANEAGCSDVLAASAVTTPDATWCTLGRAAKLAAAGDAVHVLAANPGAGLSIKGSAALSLEASAVMGNGSAGVLELAGTRDSRYIDNEIRGNGAGAATYNGDGIQLGGTGAQVVGNTIAPTGAARSSTASTQAPPRLAGRSSSTRSPTTRARTSRRPAARGSSAATG